MRASVPTSSLLFFRPKTARRPPQRTGFWTSFFLKAVAAGLGMIGLICAMICTYLYQRNGYAVPDSSADTYTALKVVETSTTVSLLLVILLKYRSFLVAEFREGRMRSASLRAAAPLWASLAVELVLCACCCPVGISWTWYSKCVGSAAVLACELPEKNLKFIFPASFHPFASYFLLHLTRYSSEYVPMPQSADGVMACVMLLRLYLLAPLLPELTGWHSPSARAAATLARTKVGDWVAMRAILHAHPILSIATLWAIAVACFSWALWATEYGVCTATTLCVGTFGIKNLNDFATSVWCIIITMLTVGYGDVSPVTSIGKMIAVVAAFTGSALNGLLVATLTSALALSPSELRARDLFYSLVNEAFTERELRWAAGKLVLESLWEHRIRGDRKRARKMRMGGSTQSDGDTNLSFELPPGLARGGGSGGDSAGKVVGSGSSSFRLPPQSSPAIGAAGSRNRRLRPRALADLPLRLRRAIKHFIGARRLREAAEEERARLSGFTVVDHVVHLKEDSRAAFRALATDLAKVCAAVNVPSEALSAAAISGPAKMSTDAPGVHAGTRMAAAVDGALALAAAKADLQFKL